MRTEIGTIILDLDGTLLTNNKSVSELTKQTLIKAQEQGIQLILASGRPTSGMLEFAEELQMHHHNGLIISFNGAHVLNYTTKETYFEHVIDCTTTTSLLRHLDEFNVTTMVTQGQTMYVHDVFSRKIDMDLMGNKYVNIIQYEARGGKFLLQEVASLAEFVDFEPHKVLIAADPKYLQSSYVAIQAPFKDTLHCVFSAPFYFEFTHKDVDKAQTLQRLYDQGFLNQGNIIAFGDGLNDLSMLGFADIGVAMANAEAVVKDVADTITLSNNDDGIAYELFTRIPSLFKYTHGLKEKE
ncbi:HAD family phosphatase [Erysipelothrix sp. HDW6C]|uniref:Cof-type HAD-IIB family hydrolase n=1 Tax=Erysipelothrix sp. HDW6C TaxID=2714930 RepID=UPI00140C8199|nr:Cof-type HAD-IIB family hydrolase [Erysipelothrix sp. HDW6C]QIK69570.1 HAD family phosphatase [Erysipelothrix sp. HDW6C]